MNEFQWADPGWVGYGVGLLLFAAGAVWLWLRFSRRRAYRELVAEVGPVRAAYRVPQGKWHPCTGEPMPEPQYAVGRASVVPRQRQVGR
ncbi:hypothetical protein [Verrucosispora sp. NA02020]|uniref:hypothetical protein n=1 Tax=Verrucosispora sp. NA02020 TaxID=2742132 RepID=UPI0015917CAA|nr:hypothetical protein [Verrucosispora sp. NA02020]QKW15318.1 hypothetical protein HUT12_22865 [Verrucosispora sp. NA02020]